MLFSSLESIDVYGNDWEEKLKLESLSSGKNYYKIHIPVDEVQIPWIWGPHIQQDTYMQINKVK